MDSFIPYTTAQLVIDGTVTEVWTHNLTDDGYPGVFEVFGTTGNFTCDQTFTRQKGDQCGNGTILPVKADLAEGDFTIETARSCCPWGGTAMVQLVMDSATADLSGYRIFPPSPSSPFYASDTQSTFTYFDFQSFFAGLPSGGILPITAALAACNGGVDMSFDSDPGSPTYGEIIYADVRPACNYILKPHADIGGMFIGTGGYVGSAYCYPVIAPDFAFPDMPDDGSPLVVSGPCVFKTKHSTDYGSLGSDSAAAGYTEGDIGAGTMDVTTYRLDMTVQTNTHIEGTGTWTLTLS